ncbi:MAG TPA: hypothetical protein VGK67_21020 [Myxococcales bacterium]|jgi:hypothetical protein
MHDFVRKLVARIGESGRPLSRNKHFHTFETPLGRQALKVSRRLRSLSKDILVQTKEGGTLRVEHQSDQAGKLRIVLHFARVKARRTVYLSQGEWELLLQEPGVREIVERPAAKAEPPPPPAPGT